MINKHNYICIYVYMYILCNLLYSQEAYNLKQWKEVSCDDIQKVILYDYIHSISYESHNFILSVAGYNIMWEFNTNKDIDATLKQIYQSTHLVSVHNLTTILSNTDHYTYLNNGRIAKWNSENNKYMLYGDMPTLGNGKIFISDDIMHLLSSNGTLYQLTLKQKIGPVGRIEIKKSNPLTYIPKENTSIVILNNQVYYFSNKGFCSINTDSTNPQLISSVTVTNETSKLITDNSSKVWIINQRDGIIEYNATNKTAHQIATFPISQFPNSAILCFYSKSYLYLILKDSNYPFSNRVYALNVTESDPDNPDNPDAPDNPSNNDKIHNQ